MNKTQKFWINVAWTLLFLTVMTALIGCAPDPNNEHDKQSMSIPDPLDPFNEKQDIHQFCYSNGVCCYRKVGFGSIGCVATHLTITAVQPKAQAAHEDEIKNWDGTEVTRRALEARIYKEIDSGGISSGDTLH